MNQSTSSPTVRERIDAILLNDAARGREQLALRLAAQAGVPIPEALGILAAAPRDPGSPAIDAAAIYARRRQEAGHASPDRADRHGGRFATAAEIYAYRAQCVEQARQRAQTERAS